MIKQKIIPVFLVISVLFIAGCTSTTQTQGDQISGDGTIIKPDGTMIKPDGTMVKPDGTMILPNGTMIEPDKNMQGNETSGETGLVTVAKNYYRYDPQLYEEAKAAGKVIFLDFHANWCPICRQENPAIKEAFNELNYEDVIGFQVHYNDDETQQFDRDLIQQFQVAYQHTKIILDKNGDVKIKTLEVFDKQRTIDEISAARV